MTLTLVTPPAVAALLPRPLDIVCRDLRALCQTAPIDQLEIALEALIVELQEDEYVDLVARSVAERLVSPSDRLHELRRHYAPDESDAPTGRLEPDEDDRDYRRWDALCARADDQAVADWRVEMAALLGELQAAARDDVRRVA